MLASTNTLTRRPSPFELDNERGYAEWRARKLDSYPVSVGDLTVEVRDLAHPTPAERAALTERCRKTNMALYVSTKRADKEAVRAFGQAMGLVRLDRNLCADDDGISALHAVEQGRAHEYIPYSNQRISWHTDGYYNPPSQQIRGMLLHCAQPAAQGGDNALLDHEIVYLLLRDASPHWLAALMEPDAMTIPPNVEAGREIRPAQTGPVFSIDPQTGDLHMRYTARTRSIVWKDQEHTRQAVEFIAKLLHAESPYVLRHRFAAGEGICCNNVLHNRSGFVDEASTGQERLMYRARYLDRVAGTWVQG